MPEIIESFVSDLMSVNPFYRGLLTGGFVVAAICLAIAIRLMFRQRAERKTAAYLWVVLDNNFSEVLAAIGDEPVTPGLVMLQGLKAVMGETAKAMQQKEETSLSRLLEALARNANGKLVQAAKRFHISIAETLTPGAP